ncbi:MAG: rane spanning protein [Clostridia bacterium]|nr:rane spanning protein [Clostridia bacterium]
MPLEKNLNTDNLLKAIKVAKSAALIILENGGETYRAEETVYKICETFGFEEIDVLAIPTGVFITVKDGEMTQSSVKRVKKRTVNLMKLYSVNNISRAVVSGDMTLEQAQEQLDKLNIGNKKKKLIPCIAAGFSAGFFTLLFGGVLIDFILSFICGIFVQLLSMSFKRIDMFHFVISLLGGVLVAFIAVMGTSIFNIGNIDKIVIGAIMPLLPGLAMTNAIRDTMTGDLVSGTARFTEALLVAIALATGVGIILSLYYAFGGTVS